MSITPNDLLRLSPLAKMATSESSPKPEHDDQSQASLQRSTSPRCVPSCFASASSSPSHPQAHLVPQRSSSFRLHLFSSSTSRSISRRSDVAERAPLNQEDPAPVQHLNGLINLGQPEKPTPVHLVVMVNGIVGSASNWKFAAEQFILKLENRVKVHCSARNAATLTFDGVDVMGHRLAEEVKSIIDETPGLEKISFIAHSLGGLVARYAIGQLYTPPERTTQSHELSRNELGRDASEPEEEATDAGENYGKIAGLQPVNFITVATPHLGSRGNRQLPLLCGMPFLEKVAVFSAHWFVGRTGRHLFMTDGSKSQPPLLLRMVTDCAEGKFISALKAFKRRVLYANITFDHMVGCRTASIRRENEIAQVSNVPVDTKYPHIIRVEDVPPDEDPDLCEGQDSDTLEEKMISGLRQVAWQRVDVSFEGSPQKLAAHSTIQVKYYWMHSEGADVIAHMIDNFVV